VSLAPSGETLDCLVRLEQRGDAGAIRAVHEAAFDTTFEARLVDRLRAKARPYLGLVATRGESVLGHILFTPVQCVASPEARLLGLAPMAVAPEWQGRGVGTRLARGGLSAARDTGALAVFVLGHADYYPRFGFAPAAARGLSCPWEVPAEAFMTRELAPGGLDGLSGEIRYHPAFDGVGIAPGGAG